LLTYSVLISAFCNLLASLRLGNVVLRTQFLQLLSATRQDIAHHA
jgi:hypothetical protein